MFNHPLTCFLRGGEPRCDYWVFKPSGRTAVK